MRSTRYGRHDVNLGFGAACNRGVRAAAHPLVLLLARRRDVLGALLTCGAFRRGDSDPLLACAA
jgi:GT2 family glycosyltransferase